jgi:hypothetical protein
MVRAGVGHLRRPSQPDPEGARTAYRGTQKTSKSCPGFKKVTGNFCRSTNPCYRLRLVPATAQRYDSGEGRWTGVR